MTLTDALASRVLAALEADPLAKPDEVAARLLAEDSSLMQGINAAAASMGSALTEGGSELASLMALTIKRLDVEGRSLESGR